MKRQQNLTETLNRPPLFWVYPEHDDKQPEVLTHVNGEILIFHHEYRKVIKAFLKIHGKNNPDGTINKNIKGNRIIKTSSDDSEENNADGTKNKKMQGNKIIKTSSHNRNRWAVKVSPFYSIFNWVSYSTKQQVKSRTQHMLETPRKPYQDKDKLGYISAELKRQSTKFYQENVR
ncbi:hypothetical protein [Methylobacter sp. S3L5C]|uniref:hypothetical protein n=1 Tax=Methylobacter sp. S3L5C TaxID=2839024 RepID=UPI001FAB71DD|nr:hypothetical protein [Methylobacter sp. S3L5C]UOA08125.1 hypothetical protein KKZ03_18180 [Methylobacter sp. S3L5C]